MAGFNEGETYSYVNNYQSEKPDNLSNKTTYRNPVMASQVITIARELEKFILAAEDDALTRLEQLGSSTT